MGDYVVKMRETLLLAKPFTVILDDPSGNSFIENPNAPGPDTGRTSEQYERTTEQDHKLGMYTQEELRTEDDPVLAKVPEDSALTVCDMCGIKTNEVKAGGGIEPLGKKITLKVTDPTDMSRDVLKSETCSIAIPELEFEMGGQALGGRFTTLEGLLNNVLDSVEQNSVWGGDGVAPDINERMTKFKQKFHECIAAAVNFTVVLDDPAGNSYMQNVYAPEEDPELNIEIYERSFDQNDDLGLNDMKVEGYEEG